MIEKKLFIYHLSYSLTSWCFFQLEIANLANKKNTRLFWNSFRIFPVSNVYYSRRFVESFQSNKFIVHFL